jgi:hypothetical protein
MIWRGLINQRLTAATFALSFALALGAVGCGGGSAPPGTQAAAQPGQHAAQATVDFRKEIDGTCLEIRHRFAEADWNGGAITAQGAIGIATLKSLHPPAGMAETYSRLVSDLKKREFARSYVVVGPSTPRYSRAVREYRLYTAKSEADAKQLGLHHCPFPLAPPGHSVTEPASGGTTSQQPGLSKREATFRQELETTCRAVRRSFVEANWNGGAINAQGFMGIGSLESAKPPSNLAPAFRKLIADLKLRHDARSYGAGNEYPKLFASYKRKYKRYSRKVRADARKLDLHACPWPMAAPGHSVFNPSIAAPVQEP